MAITAPKDIAEIVATELTPEMAKAISKVFAELGIPKEDRLIAVSVITREATEMGFRVATRSYDRGVADGLALAKGYHLT